MKKTLTLLCSVAMATLLISSCAKNGANGSADSTQASANAANNMDANKAAVRAFYDEVINAHKPDAVDKFCVANFVDHNPDMGHSGQGIDDAKKSFADWFASMPDAHVTVDNMIAEGDLVVSMVTMTGTMKGDMGGMKATNKSAKVGGVDIVRIKDGKAVERWGYFDQMAMMKQLGMMPPPPGPEKKS